MSDPKYIEWRKHTEQRFAGMRPVATAPEMHLSPSGKYSLEIIGYTSGPETWNYSRGLVRQIRSETIIADIKRNLAGFWFSWVSRPDGEYLLCGEDYQGYNVIDLANRRNVLTFPPEAYKGMGFCWGAAYPSPTGQLLAVHGSYWGGPNELVIYDFSDPCSTPLPEVARVEDMIEAKGWLSSAEFAYTTEDGDVLQQTIWQANEA